MNKMDSSAPPDRWAQCGRRGALFTFGAIGISAGVTALLFQGRFTPDEKPTPGTNAVLYHNRFDGEYSGYTLFVASNAQMPALIKRLQTKIENSISIQDRTNPEISSIEVFPQALDANGRMAEGINRRLQEVITQQIHPNFVEQSAAFARVADSKYLADRQYVIATSRGIAASFIEQNPNPMEVQTMHMERKMDRNQLLRKRDEWRGGAQLPLSQPTVKQPRSQQLQRAVDR